MATVLKLTDGTTDADLLGGVWKLAPDGWETIGGEPEPPWETFQLVARDTDANVRAAENTINKLVERARVYAANPVNSVPIWLQWQSEGESAKRALVLDGTFKVASRSNATPNLGKSGAFAELAIQRRPDWEATTVNNSTGVALSCLGGIASVGTDSGTSPQRINTFSLTAASADSTGKVWAGIRPTGAGTGGFIALWECENASTEGPNVSEVAVAGTSGGSILRSTLSTAGLMHQFTIKWGDITSTNLTNLMGSYLVLLRVKLATNTQVRLQLRAGWTGSTDSQKVIGDTYLDSSENNLTLYQLVELGEVKAPPNRMETLQGGRTLADWGVSLYAERISASGSADYDCLIMMPNEHLLVLDGLDFDNTGGLVTAYTTPIDEQYAIAGAKSGVLADCTAAFTNWTYPIGGGVLVLAAQGTTASVVTHTLTYGMTFYPRYKVYRT